MKSDGVELVNTYLNGKRTLSSNHLSHLFFSSPFAKVSLASALEHPGSRPEEESVPDTCQLMQYDVLFATTHYLGDGMALHNFATDFFVLLSSQNGLAELSLEALLQSEWDKCCSPSLFEVKEALPNNMEARIPGIGGRFRRAAARVDFQNYQRKLIVCTHYD